MAKVSGPVIDQAGVKDWFNGLSLDEKAIVLAELGELERLEKQGGIRRLEERLSFLRTGKAKKTLTAGGSVAPKYRHPSDATMTWAGRGKRPKWMEDILRTGVALDDLLIEADGR